MGEEGHNDGTHVILASSYQLHAAVMEFEFRRVDASRWLFLLLLRVLDVL